MARKSAASSKLAVPGSTRGRDVVGDRDREAPVDRAGQGVEDRLDHRWVSLFEAGHKRPRSGAAGGRAFRPGCKQGLPLELGGVRTPLRVLAGDRARNRDRWAQGGDRRW